MVVQVTELKCQKLSQVPNSRGNWRFINYKGKLYPLAKNKQTRNQTKKQLDGSSNNRFKCQNFNFCNRYCKKKIQKI